MDDCFGRSDLEAGSADDGVTDFESANSGGLGTSTVSEKYLSFDQRSVEGFPTDGFPAGGLPAGDFFVGDFFVGDLSAGDFPSGVFPDDLAPAATGGSSESMEAASSNVFSNGNFASAVGPATPGEEPMAWGGLADVCPCASDGGCTITMLPHLGQERIWPTADLSRTFSRDLQVVQEIEKDSTT